MLKWTRRILLFLLLGAIVNVAVAWGCVLRNSFTKRNIAAYLNPHDSQGITTVTTRLGFQWVANGGSREWSEQIGNILEINPGRIWWPGQHGGQSVRTHYGAGWPLLSLTTWQTFDQTDFHAHHWGIPYLQESDWRPQNIFPPALPLYPMWRGFATNSLFYAIILALAVRFGAMGRRWLRRRGNQCPACAYPRGTSPVCTECGEPLPC